MEKKTSCYVGASCTEMTCCTDDPEMDTTFSWFIDVDFCHLKLSVGIENTKQEMFLSDITFGNNQRTYMCFYERKHHIAFIYQSIFLVLFKVKKNASVYKGFIDLGKDI